MRILYLIGALFFAPNLLAYVKYTNGIYLTDGAGSWTYQVQYTPEMTYPFYFDSSTNGLPASVLAAKYGIKAFFNGEWSDCFIGTQQDRLACKVPSTGKVYQGAIVVRTYGVYSDETATPTNTCYQFKDQLIGDDYANSTSYCVNVGVTKGGNDTSPLLCSTYPLAGVGDPPKWTHAVSGDACSEESPPDDSSDTGSGDGTGGGDGGDTGSGGTGGDGTGGGTTEPTTPTADQKPITDRLDLVNASVKEVASNVAATTAAVVSLDSTLQGVGSNLSAQLDAVNGSLAQQLAATNATNQELQNGFASVNNGLSQIAEKLEEAQPTATADDVSLPDADTAHDDALNQINEAMADAIQTSGGYKLADENELRLALSTADSISDFFNFARANCQPLDFGHGVLDVCPAAEPTSQVLEYFFWGLTMIFVFTAVSSQLARERL